MRISDWSSDVCSSDLACAGKRQIAVPRMGTQHRGATQRNQKERAQDGLYGRTHPQMQTAVCQQAAYCQNCANKCEMVAMLESQFQRHHVAGNKVRTEEQEYTEGKDRKSTRLNSSH